MKIGIPKEITNNEYRVGMTPPGVKTLTQAGHSVFVELGAGVASGISNSEYIQAGALMVDKNEVWNCDVIIKVKEPPEFATLFIIIKLLLKTKFIGLFIIFRLFYIDF